MDISISKLGQYQYLGEDEIVKKENRRLLSVRCIRNCKLYFIPKQHIQRVLDDSHPLLEAFLERVRIKLEWQNVKIQSASDLLQNEYEKQFKGDIQQTLQERRDEIDQGIQKNTHF